MKYLVIAPHPDDEVLGCGGTIARYVRNGDTVFLVIVTRAYAPDWSEEFLRERPAEIQRSNRILGISKTFSLDYPTAKLDTIPQRDLNAALLGVVGEVEPDVVLIPFRGDLNRDHRIVHDASLVALRPISRRVEQVMAYETLSETEWGSRQEPFIPNVYVNISETLEQKVEAMRAYRSEIRDPPHPRSPEGIRALAARRGMEAGLDFGEAFMLEREIH